MSKHDDATRTSQASHESLAANTLFTTDEVDLYADEGIRPAPAPSAEDLAYTDVDVTTSSTSSLGSLNLSNTNEPHLKAIRLPSIEQPNDLHDIPAAVLSAPVFEPQNDGSQSPAGKILELPPAFELSEPVRSPSYANSAFPGDATATNGLERGSRLAKLSELPEHPWDDVALASPTTDAAIDRSAGPPAQGANTTPDNADSGLGIVHFIKRPRLGAREGSGPAPQIVGTSQNVPPAQTQGETGSGQQAPAAPPPPPPRPVVFAYHHDDTDTTMVELEEFFSYVELQAVIGEGRDSWARGWESLTSIDWPDAPATYKRTHISHLIEELEHRDPEIRFEAAKRLAYISQGTPICSTSPQHHLHLVISNCTLMREAGALTAVYEALKSACGRWNIFSSLPEGDAGYSHAAEHGFLAGFSPQERQEYLEEINGELAVHLAILYFMIEVFRGEEAWADELMAQDPPLPVYLLNLVATLREKAAKGYPVKKLLLLLWKTLLACFGGMKDIKRVKKLVRNIESLPEDVEQSEASGPNVQLKASVLDFATFKTDIAYKYPTYHSPTVVAPLPQIPITRIVAAAASAPLNNGFHLNHGPHLDHVNGAYNSMPTQSGPLPPTPAPSPPPTPPPNKPKKQQYQTDQNKPFVLPFSQANIGGGHYSTNKGRGKMTVPFSIDEAGKLYARNLRFSTELWQTWKLREEYLADETGVDIDGAVKSPDPSLTGPALNELTNRLDGLTISDDYPRTRPSLEEDSQIDDSRQDGLSMLYQLEAQIKAELKSLRYSNPSNLDNRDFRQAEKKLSQKIEDVKRLQRVEIVYRSTLPHMQSTVIVLLKLLLATVTANTISNANSFPEASDILPPATLEETDIMRHREITSKAVSAILISMLRWFKVSHAMKFHYLAHLLVDSNCLLLILKMFGLQEVSNQVRMKNEAEEWNFFHYCHTYCSRSPAPARPEDAMLKSKSRQGETDDERQANVNIPLDANGDMEPEVVTDFNRRNFFSVINFLHVLQKLTKRKAHRILLLVQYKSSAILKRIIKVGHPLLQLYVLKVIKSQVPYCGRKWRQANMKVITSIYINCRPDLRDEWLTTIDVDSDLDDSLPHEQTLRTLVKFYNTKHYSAFAPSLHRRSSSHISAHAIGLDPGVPGSGPTTGVPHTYHAQGSTQTNGANGYPSHRTGALPSPSGPGPLHSPGQNGAFFDNEVFPPPRPLSSFGGDDNYRTSYIPDSLMDGYLEDYEELLGDIFTPVYDASGMPISGPLSMERPAVSPGGASPHFGGMSPSRALGESQYMSSAEQAWQALGTILGESDAISDSESVGDIGYLNLASDGENSDFGSDDGPMPGTNDWEHLSPDLAHALDEEAQRMEEEDRLNDSSPNRRRRSVSPRSSPRLRRTSSSGTPRSPALRAVLADDNGNYDDDDGSAVEDDDESDAIDLHIRSPRRSPHLSPSKPAIDEVEAFFQD